MMESLDYEVPMPAEYLSRLYVIIKMLHDGRDSLILVRQFFDDYSDHFPEEERIYRLKTLLYTNCPFGIGLLSVKVLEKVMPSFIEIEEYREKTL